jgi:hypothetical protein
VIDLLPRSLAPERGMRPIQAQLPGMRPPLCATATRGLRWPSLQYLGGVVLLGAAYYGAAKVGQMLRYTASASAMWPPAGLEIGRPLPVGIVWTEKVWILNWGLLGRASNSRLVKLAGSTASALSTAVSASAGLTPGQKAFPAPRQRQDGAPALPERALAGYVTGVALAPDDKH